MGLLMKKSATQNCRGIHNVDIKSIKSAWVMARSFPKRWLLKKWSQKKKESQAERKPEYKAHGSRGSHGGLVVPVPIHIQAR
jgi:hypothetical protein